MSNIKIITDSACDIDHHDAEAYHVTVLPLTILQGDRQYRDWYDFTPEEFWKRMYEWNPLPTTSQVTPAMFLDAYKHAYEEGCDRMIVITLNSAASGTYQSALIARGLFEEEHDGNAIPIEVIDSGTYTYLVGLHVARAAKMAAEGEDYDSIIRYLNDRFHRVQAYAIVYTLDFLKRSGRISGAANFVANLLDLKPVIIIGDHDLRPVDKVRGKRKSVSKLIEMAKTAIDPNEREITIVLGDMTEEYEQLKNDLTATFPGFTINTCKLGSTITCHSGPKLLGLAYIRKEELCRR